MHGNIISSLYLISKVYIFVFENFFSPSHTTRRFRVLVLVTKRERKLIFDDNFSSKEKIDESLIS
jgi:hypothetical protein